MVRSTGTNKGQTMINIINEDCITGLKNLQNDFIELTFTSPPYFNARSYSTWNTYEDYLKFLKQTFIEVFRVTKCGRMCIVNLSPVIVARESRSKESKRIPIPFHFLAIMEKIGWKYIDDIIWVKPAGAAKNRNGGFFQHRKPVAYKPNVVTETILVFQKPANFLIDKIVRSYNGSILDNSLVKNGYEKTNVWFINPETRSKHPAPFPKELSDKVVQYYSYVGDTVLDPFVGSGTTMVSCKDMDRNGIGFEIHNKYIELAKMRIDHT